jgi:hypothetical protein|uniref:Uncharacterized protein n=1 Tax=Myoviridae sp. ctxZp7 TaxID=2823554 RepID=A0A8S5L663_9CAUD|nr:MAG TPA: hypothetical protein [Myoviridae sp. ctxZp7]
MDFENGGRQGGIRRKILRAGEKKKFCQKVFQGEIVC